MPRHTMAPPTAKQEARAVSLYGDRPAPRRGYRRCKDCPGEFPANGRKERCGPCSDAHVQKQRRERTLLARAMGTTTVLAT